MIKKINSSASTQETLIGAHVHQLVPHCLQSPNRFHLKLRSLEIGHLKALRALLPKLFVCHPYFSAGSLNGSLLQIADQMSIQCWQFQFDEVRSIFCRYWGIFKKISKIFFRLFKVVSTIFFFAVTV